MSTVLSYRILLMCRLHTCTPLILYVHVVLHHCIFSWVDLHVDFTIHECCWVAPLFCTHLCMLDLLCCICWSATFVSLFWAEVFALPFLFLFLPCLLTLKQKKKNSSQTVLCWGWSESVGSDQQTSMVMAWLFKSEKWWETHRDLRQINFQIKKISA